jgi:uncharacterized membrane protein YdfJ with MMPL/SSD domain
MSPLKHSNNIAARMGRWSASHWKTAVFGWLAFVVVAFGIATQLPMKTISTQDQNVGQAHRADEIFKKSGFKQTDSQTEFVLIQSKTLTVKSSAFRAAVADVASTVTPFKTIKNFRSPLDPAHSDQIAADSHTAVVEWDMKGNDTVAQKNIDPITKATAALAKRHPGLYIGEAGSASSNKAINELFNKQLAQAGIRSVPLTLLILLLVFGSIVAAGVPLLLALTSVLATIGLLSLPSRLLPMDQAVSEVVLLIGLAVGVDYALFYLKREREERAAGRGHRAALEAAAATSGRSVLISGLTVMASMAGLFFSGDRTFRSFGVGTIMVVAIAMLGSLTVLPALLSKLGDRVEKGRIPFLGRLRRPSGENRMWTKLLTPALRHPVIAAAASAAVLLTMAVPVLHLHTAQSGIGGLPRNAPTVETLDRIQEAFVGTTEPAVIAVTTPTTDSSDFKNAYNAFRSKALATGQMHGPVQLEVDKSHKVARITISLSGNGVDKTSNAALAELRNNVLPSTIGTLPRTNYAVTGSTAASYDANSAMKHSAPLVFGFVLLLAFLLLLASFRSIVIAAKAVVLNLLSVGAAYGVVIAVFQWGWGENILNFHSNGGIASWLPIFMFVILGAFGIFATLPFLDFKEMGIGLAAAVLIDATIVRAVLLPATMRLLGDWNWYLPRWLSWLPKLEHADEPDAPLVPAAVAA